MTPETIHETDLSAADEAMIVDLLMRAFGPDFEGRSYFKQRPHLRFVIRDEGRIVSHLTVAFRDIRLGEARVTIGGIGEVATDATHRGRGHAGHVLDAAIAHLRGSLAEFALLYGDAPLYEARGFVHATNRLTFPRLDAARTGGVQSRVVEGFKVLPLGARRWDFAAPVDLVGHLF